MTDKIDRSHFVSSTIKDAELVIGVVAPVGTDVDFVQRTIEDRLKNFFEYSLEPIPLSSLIDALAELDTPTKDAPEGTRISRYMDAGNQLRRHRADILALAAINEIQGRRANRTGDRRQPCERVAYFLRTLKHPEEVKTLREVYGHGFFLLGVSSSPSERLNYLHTKKNVPPEQAKKLLQRDESDSEGHGQQTRKAFEMADAFISIGPNQDANENELWRLLDLLFGQSFLTPTQEEHAMFLAYSTSLRSADLSRQVGAVILSAEGEVIATGANDVPRARGGQYWTEGFVGWPDKKPKHDNRDWAKGEDSNKRRRDEIIRDFRDRVVMIARMDAINAVKAFDDSQLDPKSREQLLEKLNTWTPSQKTLLEKLEGSPIMDLTEFGRAVHAEMEALLCCARIGISPRGGRLFTTTFPCHNCTKHIIAAGIAEVHYIEPYPKSLAEELHGDEIIVTTGDSSTTKDGSGRVIFRSFSGVGPRRFFDLFSLHLGAGRIVNRKEDVHKPDDETDGYKADGWKRDKQTQLRISIVPTSALDREDNAMVALKKPIEAGDEDQNQKKH